MYIDTHAHLYLDHFSGDIKNVIQAAQDVGVEQILLPNIDPDTVDTLHQLEKKYPLLCRSMMGLHPCSVREDYREKLDVIMTYLNQGDYIAVGEIGMDLYWDKTHIEQQREAFIHQVRWAAIHHKPIVIHSRESIDLIIEILETLALPGLSGVFHCFTGTIEQARRIIDLGFLMGIGGVVTFKNSTLPQVLSDIPLSKIILETDAPYLAPHPNRGKRNESAFLIHVALKLAAIYNVPVENIGNQTTQNAKKLFHLTPISS